ncbi:hypothetical protein ACIO3S_09080 [Nocardioides sp. NPDC087217]|uniref:hypothetical protein n=1 Tax=Nocardioides sp. NPDC087217 TaxID=3364335 RepID=UPI00380EFED9
MATTVIEIERTYDVDEDALLPDLAGLPDAAQVDPQGTLALSAAPPDLDDATVADEHAHERTVSRLLRPKSRRWLR